MVHDCKEKIGEFGPILKSGAEQEVVHLTFDGIEFQVIFISPFAETHHDEELMQMSLDTLDAQDLSPEPNSRLIKFCRSGAEKHPFHPKDWRLPNPAHVFHFFRCIEEIMRMYWAAMPHIRQFYFLPSTAKLEHIYCRVYARLSRRLGDNVIAILPTTGAIHAYQRT